MIEYYILNNTENHKDSLLSLEFAASHVGLQIYNLQTAAQMFINY